MNAKSYPQNPQEWRNTIQHGMGISTEDALIAFQADLFPYEQLEQWLMSTFKQGYSSDFVPALRRNIKGLVGWVYGGESEPYWPGSDGT
jgi:hypothetical protein